MAIAFRCPNCDKRFSVRDELAGRQAKCPCGLQLLVPELDPPELEATEETLVPIEEPPQSSFADWLDEGLEENTSQQSAESEYGFSAEEPAGAASRPAPYVRPATSRPSSSSSQGSDGEGGLAGLIVFVLIFVVGNAILYHFTGWLIIPIPRK